MIVDLSTFVFIAAAFALIAMMTLFWLVSLMLKNSSIVDISWGLGFILVAWLDYALSIFVSPAKWLMLILVHIWGLRLALYMFIRNRRKEDFRYAKWREQYGERWWWYSYIQVFLLQAGVAWIIAAPILAIRVTDGIPPLSGLDILGALLWCIGFYFEAVGDWQLIRFKADPVNKGKVLTSGLWKYSRHPNYFGDAVLWFGLYLIAANAGAWWTIYSPLLLTFILLRVSGVTMLEKAMRSRPGYEDYIQRTSAFIPWFPKKSSS